ncbi:hypothetical protein BaLi_c06300 [Bacillus paralicheniformis ATCC 9945a]|nr:hypothetical protein BaLi_c06300 [Bacillus paralicheniformis ATCC 9945a]
MLIADQELNFQTRYTEHTPRLRSALPKKPIDCVEISFCSAFVPPNTSCSLKYLYCITKADVRSSLAYQALNDKTFPIKNRPSTICCLARASRFSGKPE